MSKAELGRVLGVSRQAVDEWLTKDSKRATAPRFDRISILLERFPKLEPPLYKGYRLPVGAYMSSAPPKRPSPTQLSLFDAIRSLTNDKLAVKVAPGRSSSSTVTLEVEVKFVG